MSTKTTIFTKGLYTWYAVHKRTLPWRDTSNPYWIWLSEVILQQTRVNQGLPYFYKFVEKFPKIEDLAQADLNEILTLWQGLGYYSRARNMHKTAKSIVKNFPDAFPSTYKDLISLKGIGPYTAAAVASFAYNLPHAVCDGNVTRVMSRLGMIETPVQTAKGKFEIHNELMLWFDIKNPALFNQAIMELGALVCIPKNPKCTICPLSGVCTSFKHNVQHLLPVKLKPKPKRIRYFHYWVVLYGDKIGVVQRREGDVWEGLFEFILYEASTADIDISYWQSKFEIQNNFLQVISDELTQILSHQKIIARFYISDISKNDNLYNVLQNNELCQFVHFSELENLAKPVLIKKFIELYLK